MPTVKVLQPVLKMKVDELFLCWLSETATQVMLKDYLRSITSEEKIEIGSGDAGDNENILSQINYVSKQSMLGSLISPLTPTSPPHLSTALPFSTSTSPRSCSGIRGKRRSSSSRNVSGLIMSSVTRLDQISCTVTRSYFDQLVCCCRNVMLLKMFSLVPDTFVNFSTIS